MKTAGGEDVTWCFSLDRLGAKGMFIGMISCFLWLEKSTAESRKRGWQIKMPDGVPPAVTKIICRFDPRCSDTNYFLSNQCCDDWYFQC